MGNTIVQRHNTQLSSIIRNTEQMRRSNYVTNVEKMLNGSYNSAGEDSLLLFRSNDQYLEYLRDWYFCKFLVDIFRAPIADIVSKTNIRVTINDDKAANLENWVNKRIQNAHLKEEIEDSLSDIIYYGRFFRVLVKSTNDAKDFSLAKIKDETEVQFAYQMNDHIGYVVNPGSDSIFLTRSKAVGSAYMFRNPQFKSMSEIDPGILEELKKSLNFDSINPDLLEHIVGMETKTPSSSFWDQAGILFKTYINEILIQFAQLRDTFKQNLLAVTIDGTQKNVAQASSVASSIEAVVNQDASVLYNQSVPALINQMIAKMMNDTRVLPQIAEYSNISQLKWNDRAEDIDRLMNEYQNLKNQVLSSLGIPQVVAGGEANRWEILGQNENFSQVLATYTDMCTDIVKTFAQSVLLARGFYVSKEDIIFSYRVDTELQAQMNKHKMNNLDAELSQLNNIINNFRALVGTGMLDAQKAVGEFMEKFRTDQLTFNKSLVTEEEFIQFLMGG